VFHRPHTNSRETGQKWWDFYDQETMELTLEMYGMDFEVFGYERTIKQRPDLVPPKKDRSIMLEMSKYDGFSRNSSLGTDGIRLSQRSLFSSVRSSINADNARKSYTLKQSLIEGNKDELFGALVGFRFFSEVAEVNEDKLE
jgi:hypothetical protein